MSNFYTHDNRVQAENYKLRKLLEKIQSEGHLDDLTKLHAEEIAKMDRKIVQLENRNTKLSEQNSVHLNKIINLKSDLNNAKLTLKDYNTQLKRKEKEALALHKQIGDLKKINQNQLATQAEIIDLEVIKKVRALQIELADKDGIIQKLTGQINRDFKNSSIPSSQCMGHGTIHNGREKTSLKPGGQPGHIGHHRIKHVSTNQFVLSAPCTCISCSGRNLKPTGKSKTRQQVDLKVVVAATDIISEEYLCTECGANFYTEYPSGLSNEVNYGPEVKSLASFLNNYCNVSLDKTAETISEITAGALTISKGTLSNLSKEFSMRVSTPIEEIIKDLRQSPVINTDSSNGRESGKNVFFHVFANKNSRVYLANAHKGIAALTGSPIDDYAGILVHDHDLTYYHFGGHHQECNIHISRYLLDAIENEPKLKWHVQMRELLLNMNSARKIMIKEGRNSFDSKLIATFKQRYDEILDLADREYLEYPPNKYIYKGFNLARRLRKYKQNHLLFLDNFNVPFDNNLSERSIRVAKGKMKVVGTFRSMPHGMQRYCDFLTITETSKSRGINVYQTLKNIFRGEKDIWTLQT